MSLVGRVALVSGGGRGIGKAISMRLAADGAKVAINYHRFETNAVETRDLILQVDGEAQTYKASVESFEECQQMVEQVSAELGPISLLVNNAGIASRGLSVADTNPDEVARVISTHALGSHNLCKLVIPAMRNMGRGDIIMISSSATKAFAANGAPYNMAKAALEALAYTLYKEERAYGIRVNTVAPGLVETEMGRRLVRATAGILDMRELDEGSPFGKVCQPEDVANVVSYLVSNENAYVTGERIYCDGGGNINPS